VTDTRTEHEVSCKDCMFWEPGNSTCRRYSPKSSDPNGKTLWPPTAPNDWCGEFENVEIGANPSMSAVYHTLRTAKERMMRRQAIRTRGHPARAGLALARKV